MYQETTLTMPKQFAALTAEEMTYTDGGSKSIPMNTSFLSKDYCYQKAADYVNSASYNPDNLGRTRIAKELYAHAFLYYYGVSASLIASINAACLGNPILAAGAIAAAYYMHDRGQSVELGGDSNFRVFVYNLLW